jgi:hypothetical protein
MKPLSKQVVEVILLVVACSWSFFSFYNSFGLDPHLFFARSGAVVVLLAVIVQYRLNRDNYILLHNIFVLKNQGYKVTPVIPRRHHIVAVTSHALVIIGTVIWGYGDIWHKYIT